MITRYDRRAFIAGTAASIGLAACGLSAEGQPPRRYKIGILSSGPPATAADPLFVAMREVLAAAGYIEGENLAIESRFADGRFEALPDLARELVGLRLDVILTGTTAPTQAALSVTKTIPIVMVSSHDPIAAGVVTSLARPGGNVTGQSLVGGELMPKQLEVLREIVPDLTRVAYMTPVAPPAAAGFPSVTDVFTGQMREAATRARLQLQVLEVRDADELERAVTAIGRERPHALLLIESPFWGTQAGGRPLLARIVQMTIQQRLPSLSGLGFYAERGLLVAYGNAATNDELWRGAAAYAVKILKGARPGDLPIEQPTKFDLVINLKSAKDLGLTIPQSVLSRASRVIQ